MLTAFDVGVAVLILISAILATARGFTREVLSLATWAGSAAIAAYMYFYHKDIARGFIQGDIVPDAVTVIGSFLVSLIVLHLITMWIADLVVDSRVGPLDRTLGFAFGVARGVLIAIVVTVFGIWLLGPQLPSWANESKSLPILQGWGNSLIALLPDDLEKQLTDILQKRTGDETAGSDDATTGEDAPADTAPADATASSAAANT
ncbi:MAG TPA: CvpA family protein [Devosia sp.]|nr:CvpA family protein [Devosia sp.]